MRKGAILFAASASGSGKTLITCGMLQALKNRGLNLASFKCGPDYIDPMFHRTVLGIDSANIDLFFSDENQAKALFQASSVSEDLCVIEGVMGFYDGMGAASYEASSYHVAKTLGVPVIMVINAKGQSLSALPVLKGMADFHVDSNIKGVIFNNMSEYVYKALKNEVEKSTGVKPLGYLPKVNELAIESRHLGLKTPEEIEGLSDRLNNLAQVLEKTVDIDGVLEIAREYKETPCESLEVPLVSGNPIIGIARDEAFNFYYKDNVRLLTEMGAEIVSFSPLHDSELSPIIDGLIIGGGYPELYLDKLEENKDMGQAIKNAISSGIPCLAECGGFMCLHQQVEDVNHKLYNGWGVLPGKAYKTEKLVRFGYIDITANQCNDLLEEGEVIKGHEFHYYDSECCGNSFKATRPSNGRSWNCVNAEGNLVAGFPHLFYYSNPKFIERFLDKTVEYKKRKEQ